MLPSEISLAEHLHFGLLLHRCLSCLLVEDPPSLLEGPLHLCRCAEMLVERFLSKVWMTQRLSSQCSTGCLGFEQPWPSEKMFIDAARLTSQPWTQQLRNGGRKFQIKAQLSALLTDAVCRPAQLSHNSPFCLVGHSSTSCLLEVGSDGRLGL